MNNQEYVCIEYYHLNIREFFLPNLVYIFHESLLRDGIFLNNQFNCAIPNMLFNHHFMLKQNWLREQKINLILNS